MATDQRAEQLEAWNRAAAGWERRNDEMAEMARAVAERMVALLDPQPGETVLELGAGIGDTGYLAAPRLGAGGRLISTDFAAGMVEAAQRRAAALGLENVEHRVMDAVAIDLADASVDGVLSRFAVMLVPEPGRVLAETRRVLRPDGGRAVFAVWGDRERNPWATTFGRAMMRGGYMPPPQEGDPGPFSLADREVANALARNAGFVEVEFEDVDVVAEHASFDAYWASVMDMAASTSAIVAGLPKEERAALRAAVEADAAPYRQDDGSLRLPGAALVFRLA
jgi:ubiquinone/menaquinone biosynthesis C-methylase UbiE